MSFNCSQNCIVATEHTNTTRLVRVQSSILAQYILLLLTDYCTKGYCNPGDQRFAIEMGRQGIQEGKNISLYAVSKAMGFIPRNKLGHSFFRWVRVCLQERSVVLKVRVICPGADRWCSRAFKYTREFRVGCALRAGSPSCRCGPSFLQAVV